MRATSALQGRTLVDILRIRADEAGDRPVFRHLAHGQQSPEILSYTELDRKAQAIGAVLQKRGATGERVLLLYRTGLEFVKAFWGCMYAGAVAVPCYPPASRRHADQVRGILQGAQAAFVLCERVIFERAAGLLAAAGPASPQWVDIDEISDASASRWQPPNGDLNDLALLQYTSGSTRAPRGVMVSHGNLLHNEQLISDSFRTGPESIILSWLPPYHDMGLIGGLMQPVFAGATCVLMDSTDFIQRPFRWLKGISDFKATISGGPNFAYDLCTAKITEEEKQRLDLSSWKAAFAGAEPVFPETMERFAAAFAPCGFQKEALYPCYGLAEATLMVTGGSVESPAVSASFDGDTLERGLLQTAGDATQRRRRLMGCGKAAGQQRVVIVDPETREPRPGGVVGEIWISGPSVARGYWQQTSETDEVFHARLATDDETKFLRTGDLGGFFQGELYVCGRSKEVIILRGRNYHAEDIEETARTAHSVLRTGRAAAFGVVRKEHEDLVVVNEVEETRRDDWREVLDAILEAVLTEHGVSPAEVLLVRRGAIPRTTSGKVERSKCRKMFLEGSFKACGARVLGGEDSPFASVTSPAEELRSREGIRNYLTAELGRRLGLSPEAIDVTAPLVSLGIDSLGAANVASQIETVFGVSLPMQTILDGCSVQQLCSYVEDRLANPSPTLKTGAAGEPDARAASPDQDRLWLEHQLAEDAAVLNLQAAYLCEGELDFARVSSSIRAVVQRHQCLRTRFVYSGGRILRNVEAGGDVVPVMVDAEQIFSSKGEALIGSVLRMDLSHPFDLERGPVMRATVLRLSPERHVLAFTAHHIACDAASLDVLVRDFHESYVADSKLKMPLAAQYSDYDRLVRERLTPESLERQRAYWKQRLSGSRNSGGAVSQSKRCSEAVQFSFAVPAELTEGLRRLARENGVTLFTVLLAVWKAVVGRRTGRSHVVVASPFRNRSIPGFENAIGPFARPLLLVTDVSGNPTSGELLQRVKTTLLEAYANADLPFTETLALAGLRDSGGVKHSANVEIMFSMLEATPVEVEMPKARLTRIPTPMGTGDVGMFAALAPEGDGLRGMILSTTELFDPAEMARLFGEVLERARAGGAWSASEAVGHAVSPAVQQPVPAVISASFTAEPIMPILAFWARLLEIDFAFEFAPHNQVMQQLLDPDSRMARNRRGINILMVRASDFQEMSGETQGGVLQVAEFAAALRALSQGSHQHIVCLCPSATGRDPVRIEAVEKLVREALLPIAGIHLLGHEEVNAVYPVDGWHDEYSEELASIPYKDEYFAALGTSLVRALCALQRRFRYKVIVLDCDNTLWRGVCGEDGSAGLEIDENRKLMQEWLVAQQEQGLLLCLCSKNNEEDVRAVFRDRSDMPLRWHHFAAAKLNWMPKSQSLRELARELSLGLDSFIFVDDNRVECAEVEANCPEVLTVHLPEGSDPLRTLRHVWAFDQARSTKEAQNRTLFYRQNIERENFRVKAPSLATFLAGLDTRVTIFEPAGHQILRLAELTARTNQFNANPRVRTETEVHSMLQEPSRHVMAVRVEDRFGDFGIVGLATGTISPPVMLVDTFLLSCRALGRGVEHRMLSELGQIALRHGAADLAVEITRSGRNEPAMNFFRAIPESGVIPEESGVVRIPAARAATLRYVPSERAESGLPSPETQEEDRAPREVSGNPVALLRHIAAELKTPAMILAAARRQQHVARRTGVEAETAPRTPTEARIAAMMAELLGLEKVGVAEDFFQIGGHSLTAIRLLAKIHEEFHVSLPVQALFSISPTAAGLGEMVDETFIQQSAAADIEAALSEISALSEDEVGRLLGEVQ